MMRKIRIRKIVAVLLVAAMCVQMQGVAVFADEVIPEQETAAASDTVPVQETGAEPETVPGAEPGDTVSGQETATEETPDDAVSENETVIPETPEAGVSDDAVPVEVSKNTAEDAAGDGEHVIDGEWEFDPELSGENQIVVTRYVGKEKYVYVPNELSKELVVPGQTGTAPVKLSDDFDFGSRKSRIREVIFEGGVEVNNFAGLFEGMTELENADLSQILIQNESAFVWENTFKDCVNLKIIKLPSVNISDSAFYAKQMFMNCKSLAVLDLSPIIPDLGFDEERSDAAEKMFYGCSKLRKIYVGSSMNISKPSVSDQMFEGCLALEGDKGTKYSTAGVNNSTYGHLDGGEQNPGYFSNAYERPLTTDDGWEYSIDEEYAKVYLERYVGNDTDVVIPGRIEAKQTEISANSFSSLFPEDMKDSMTSITVKSGVMILPSTSFQSAFEGYSKLQKADLGGFDLPITPDSHRHYLGNMQYMFKDCKSLKSVTLPRNANPVNTVGTFLSCNKLAVIDLSDVALGEIAYCGYMFSGCTELRKIYVRGNGDAGTSYRYDFPETSNDCAGMFEGCISLVGGKGTRYSKVTGKEKDDYTYCRVDGVGGQPGFLSTRYSYGSSISNRIDIGDYTYSFINSYGENGLGYKESEKYHIPEKRYQELFGEKRGSNIFYFFDDEWGGSCYGLSATSSMFYKGNDSKDGERSIPQKWDYSTTSYEYPRNLSLPEEVDRDVSDDEEEDLYDDLRKYIEAMQIAQYDERVQFCYSLDAMPEEIVSEIEADMQSGILGQGEPMPKPVIIGMFGPEGGHAVLGYAVERVGSTPVAIHIYDSNWPEEDRCIELRCDADGTVTGWHYDISDDIHWGTDPGDGKDCVLTYIPYEVFSAVWKDRGEYDNEEWGEKLWELFADREDAWSALDELIFSDPWSSNLQYESYREDLEIFDEDLQKLNEDGSIDEVTEAEVAFFIANRDKSFSEYEIFLKNSGPEPKMKPAVCAAGSCTMRIFQSRQVRNTDTMTMTMLLRINYSSCGGMTLRMMMK